MKESHSRSILKGITWRIWGTLDTIALSYLVTGNVKHSVSIGLTEVLTKIILYYVHDRIWLIFPPRGTYSDLSSHRRSLVRGITWRIVGTLDTMFIAYFITGKPLNAIRIGGFEVFTKIGFFYLHERIWSTVKWGQITIPKKESSQAEKSTKVVLLTGSHQSH